MAASREATAAVTADHSPAAHVQGLEPATQALHADDYLNLQPDVSPAMHVSTTFRYAKKPEDLVRARELDVCLLSTL